MDELEKRIEELEQEVKDLEKENRKLEIERSDKSDEIDDLDSKIVGLELNIEEAESWPEVTTLKDERKRDIIAEYWDKYTPEQFEERLK